MQCSQCQNENPVEANFCLNCGTRLAKVCPQCQQVLPPEANFCMGCGQALASPSQPEQQPATEQERDPASYTPQYLAEKILTSRSTLEGERKQVTVMFCDIKDSTELIRDLDPETAQQILSPIAGATGLTGGAGSGWLSPNISMSATSSPSTSEATQPTPQSDTSNDESLQAWLILLGWTVEEYAERLDQGVTPEDIVPHLNRSFGRIRKFRPTPAFADSVRVPFWMELDRLRDTCGFEHKAINKLPQRKLGLTQAHLIHGKRAIGISIYRSLLLRFLSFLKDEPEDTLEAWLNLFDLTPKSFQRKVGFRKRKVQALLKKTREQWDTDSAAVIWRVIGQEFDALLKSVNGLTLLKWNQEVALKRQHLQELMEGKFPMTLSLARHLRENLRELAKQTQNKFDRRPDPKPSAPSPQQLLEAGLMNTGWRPANSEPYLQEILVAMDRRGWKLPDFLVALKSLEGKSLRDESGTAMVFAVQNAKEPKDVGSAFPEDSPSGPGKSVIISLSLFPFVNGAEDLSYTLTHETLAMNLSDFDALRTIIVLFLVVLIWWIMTTWLPAHIMNVVKESGLCGLWPIGSAHTFRLCSLIHNQTTGIFRRFDNLREKYLTEDLPRLLM